jgi:hypothetical protein
MDEELFVVAESVEGIEDGKSLRLVGVKRRRKNDAVGNAAGEDFAGEGIAFDAAGGGEEREVNEVEEGKEVKERPEVSGVRS